MPERRVSISVAGRTLMVTPEMYERLTSPDGWGDLSISELAEIGIQPGTSQTGEASATAVFRDPDESDG